MFNGVKIVQSANYSGRERWKMNFGRTTCDEGRRTTSMRAWKILTKDDLWWSTYERIDKFTETIPKKNERWSNLYNLGMSFSANPKIWIYMKNNAENTRLERRKKNSFSGNSFFLYHSKKSLSESSIYRTMIHIRPAIVLWDRLNRTYC